MATQTEERMALSRSWVGRIWMFGVFFCVFSVEAVAQEMSSMTLVATQSEAVSEVQAVVRYQYEDHRKVRRDPGEKTETVTKELVIVGPGVNYDANRGIGEPHLVRSNALLSAGTRPSVAYQSLESTLEVYLPTNAAGTLELVRNGHRVTSQLVGAFAVPAEKKTDKTALYSNAFTDTDLEWEVANGYLKEQLLLRSNKAPTAFIVNLQSQSLSFLVPDRSRGARAFVELSRFGESQTVIGSLLLASAEDNSQGQISIEHPFVVDAKGTRVDLECTLTRSFAGIMQYRMEIPDSFLADPSLEYPLIVDPTYVTVSSASYPTTYKSGVTYYISGVVTYSSGDIEVEPNAILKYGPGYGSYLEITNGASLSVNGTPYNYALFTSGYDDSIGVDTDGTSKPLSEQTPTASDGGLAIVFRGTNSNGGPTVKYAKFTYMKDALFFHARDSAIDGVVENCVFRYNDNTCMYIAGYTSPTAMLVNNCLFEGMEGCNSRGIFLHSSSAYSSPSLTVTNCTFHEYPRGVHLYSTDNGDPVYNIQRNIFSDIGVVTPWYNTCCVDGADPDPYDSTIDNNGLTSCVQYVSNGLVAGVHLTTDTWPFQSSATGSFYLLGSSEFCNAGLISAVEAGLNDKTTSAALSSNGRLVNQDISSDVVWSPIQTDDETSVALGYHYDPVDYILDFSNNNYPSEELLVTYAKVTVLPGVTVAFKPYDGEAIPEDYIIGVYDSGIIDMRGNGSEPIRVMSTLSVGDKTGDSQWSPYVPGNGPLFGGIRHYGEWNRSWYEYVIIEEANEALRIASPTGYPCDLEVLGCRFRACNYGVRHDSVGSNDLTVRNCLFIDMPLYGVYSAEATSLGVVNCTFYNCGDGSIATNAAIALTTSSFTNTVIKNNLLVGNKRGIYTFNSNRPGGEDYNCFYINWQGDTNFTTGTHDIVDTNPAFRHLQGSNSLYDKFYLLQDYLHSWFSVCVNAGDSSYDRFLGTATDGSIDIGIVDIGYHYPVKGLASVASNKFFKFENGEYCYPVGVTLAGGYTEGGNEAVHPLNWDYSESDPDSILFWGTTVPLYANTLSRHGVNMVQVYPHRASLSILTTEGGDLLTTSVEQHNRLFDALEDEDIFYNVVTYDYQSMQHNVFSNDPEDDRSIYLDINGGTVDRYRRGEFFEPDTASRSAREDYADSLEQFVSNDTYLPTAPSAFWKYWYHRKGLFGWDVFSEIDMIETNYAWIDEETTSTKISRDLTSNWEPYLLKHEARLELDWVPDVLTTMTAAENTALNARHIRSVDVSNLKRFKYWMWDPSDAVYDFKPGPDYLDEVSEIDFVDYHLKSGLIGEIVEKPENIIEPIQEYLGVPYLLTAGEDGIVNAWTDTEVTMEFRKHTSAVNAVTFSSNGADVLSADDASTIIFWTINNGQIQPNPDIFNEDTYEDAHASTTHINAVKFLGTLDSSFVSGGDDGKCKVWRYQGGPLKWIVEATLDFGSEVKSLDTSGGGKWIVACGASNSAKLWEYRGSTLGWVSPTTGTYNHGSSLWDVAFSPSGSRLLTGGEDGNVKIWTTADGGLDKTLQYDIGGDGGYTGIVFSVSYGPDERLVLAGGRDTRGGVYTTGNEQAYAKVWSYNPSNNTWSPPNEYKHAGSGYDVYTADFTPGGLMFVTAGSDGTAKIWNLYSPNAPAYVLAGGHATGNSINDVAVPPHRQWAYQSQLPEVIDYYRDPNQVTTKRGFFSSYVGLTEAVFGATNETNSKRLMNDCYHNYLWMAFASGSVGGPIAFEPPQMFATVDEAKYYDLSGQLFLNENPDLTNILTLGNYTEEILDSLLSLSRFTSLVRWREVGDDWRPMRAENSPTSMSLKSNSGAGGAVLSQNDWLWTGASDGKYAVGWILNNYTLSSDRWSYDAVGTSTLPWMRIEGMDSVSGLELVWFDDRRGTIIKRESVSGPTIEKQVPATESDGDFGKSVAFLIQPAGYTPDRVFAELPNELIGQIDVQNAASWHEEQPTVVSGSPYTYNARTRPVIDNPNDYYYRWTVEDADETPDSGDGKDSVSVTITGSGLKKATVDIERPEGNRVCGDIIYVQVVASP